MRRNLTLIEAAPMAAVLAGAAAAPASQAGGTKPPNVIIILADDPGCGDLGCHGHPSCRAIQSRLAVVSRPSQTPETKKPLRSWSC